MTLLILVLAMQFAMLWSVLGLIPATELMAIVMTTGGAAWGLVQLGNKTGKTISLLAQPTEGGGHGGPSV